MVQFAGLCMFLPTAALTDAGALVIVFSTIVGFWTMWQIKALYYDRKRNMVGCNCRHNSHVTSTGGQITCTCECLEIATA